MEKPPNSPTLSNQSSPGCFAIFCAWSSAGLSVCMLIALPAMLDLESGYLVEGLFGIVIWGALAAIPIGLIELIGGLIQYSRSRIAQLGYYLTISGLYLVGFALFASDSLRIDNEIIGTFLLVIPVALSWYLTWINYRVLPRHILPPMEMEDILDA